MTNGYNGPDRDQNNTGKNKYRSRIPIPENISILLPNYNVKTANSYTPHTKPMQWLPIHKLIQTLRPIG